MINECCTLAILCHTWQVQEARAVTGEVQLLDHKSRSFASGEGYGRDFLKYIDQIDRSKITHNVRAQHMCPSYDRNQVLTYAA